MKRKKRGGGGDDRKLREIEGGNRMEKGRLRVIND